MELVFATKNKNKISEIRSLVPKDINILSLQDINCNEELLETQDTVKGNSHQKARYIFDNYGCNCFADDSGLEIDVLNGEPGVYSARYAGKECSAKENINKVLYKLRNIDNRKAVFRTVITLILDKKEYSFEGLCRGYISYKESGVQGFGYDPIFIPDGYQCTFAEMNKTQKGEISHRGKAVRKLLNFLSIS